jgi:hypothetical protein
MSPAGFKTVVSETERSQTHTLDRAATGIAKERFLAHFKNARFFISIRIATEDSLRTIPDSNNLCDIVRVLPTGSLTSSYGKEADRK